MTHSNGAPADEPRRQSQPITAALRSPGHRKALVVMATKRSPRQWQSMRERATATLAQARAPQGRHGLLGIYLNDHLAGATIGTELAQRIAGSRQQAGDRETLRRPAGEISMTGRPCSK